MDIIQTSMFDPDDEIEDNLDDDELEELLEEYD